MAQVELDKEAQIFKIVGWPEAQVTGRFGCSLLYKYGDYNFHPRAIAVLSQVKRLKFREDDVILTMFPKSGSTWLSECIFLVVNQYQFEIASKSSIEYRFPQIDSPSHDVFDLILEQYDNHERRLIKASIPPNLLIDRTKDSADIDKTDRHSVKPKVISVFRNPRDVLVSFYHHCKTVRHYDVDFSFNEFFDTFVVGKVPCGPIWRMYNDAYRYHCENPKTTLIIFYEDMKKDLRNEVRRICKFLNKQEPTDEDQWALLLDHLSVDRMRQNRTINRHDWTQLGLRNENGFEFVRKGQVNDWKNFFSEEQSNIFDKVVTENLIPELQEIYKPVY